MTSRVLIRKRKTLPRKYARRTFVPRAVALTQHGMYGLPPQAFATLRYVQCTVFNPLAADSAQGNIYSLNDMRDPDVTGTGHQPLGFDQYMSQFRHFMVYACRVTARATTASANQPVSSTAEYRTNFQIALLPQRDNTVNTDPDTVCELTPYVSQYAQRAPVSVTTGWIDIARMAGKTRAALFDDMSWAGQASVSPGQLMYCPVYQLTSVSWDCQVQINIQVTIEYKAKFWERVTLASS